jgi:hypothetical protein
LALLVDAENVAASRAGAILAAAGMLGNLVVRRVYGDFCHPGMSPWCEAVGRYGLSAQQQFCTAAGKNAADIALVIDAMDLLHSGSVDAFCLVTSDSDFTRLAVRLREGGVRVTLMGEGKTKGSFRAACDQFIELPGRVEKVAVVAAVPKAPKPPKPRVKTPVGASKAAPVGPMLKAAVEAAADGDGWARLAVVGSTLRRLNPDFVLKDYGCSTLRRLCGQIDGVEIGEVDGRPARVRLRS